MTIADYRHHGRARVQRLDQRGHEIGGARAQSRVNQADPAGHLGVGIGGKRTAAFVVDEVVTETQDRAVTGPRTEDYRQSSQKFPR